MSKNVRARIRRFVGLVRALAPFIAGASRMAPGRFASYTTVAAGLWSATFCLLGYAFWQSLDQLVAITKHGTLALGVVIAVGFGVIVCRRARSSCRHGASEASRGSLPPTEDHERQRSAQRRPARLLGSPEGRAGEVDSRYGTTEGDQQDTASRSERDGRVGEVRNAVDAQAPGHGEGAGAEPADHRGRHRRCGRWTRQESLARLLGGPEPGRLR
jgi:hypothetical protein